MAEATAWVMMLKLDKDKTKPVLEMYEMYPLILCKDCKHHGQGTCSAAAGIAYPPPDEWYCADGERRTDDA